MKGVIEFDLNDMDDKDAFNRMVKAEDAFIALHGIQEFLFNVRDNENVDKERVINEVLDLIYSEVGALGDYIR